jgi:hypothetical protein
MARNQVVMPGFAAFHLGIQSDQTPSDDGEADVASDEQGANDDYVDGMSE